MICAQTLSEHSKANNMLSATEIAILHDRWTGEWHAELPQAVNESGTDFLQTVLANHLANFHIWHAEDETRLAEASDHHVARAKRLIDRENQRRNDFAELCDTILLDFLERHGLPNREAELHTETPGLIIDRLSILSLKLFHTAEEVYRDRCAARPRRAQPRAPPHPDRAVRRPGEGPRPPMATMYSPASAASSSTGS
jgi:hypothetical protein